MSRLRTIPPRSPHLPRGRDVVFSPAGRRLFGAAMRPARSDHDLQSRGRPCPQTAPPRISGPPDCRPRRRCRPPGRRRLFFPLDDRGRRAPRRPGGQPSPLGRTCSSVAWAQPPVPRRASSTVLRECGVTRAFPLFVSLPTPYPAAALPRVVGISRSPCTASCNRAHLPSRKTWPAEVSRNRHAVLGRRCSHLHA
jgi:hypothetical protein